MAGSHFDWQAGHSDISVRVKYDVGVNRLRPLIATRLALGESVASADNATVAAEGTDARCLGRNGRLNVRVSARSWPTCARHHVSGVRSHDCWAWLYSSATPTPQSYTVARVPPRRGSFLTPRPNYSNCRPCGPGCSECDFVKVIRFTHKNQLLIKSVINSCRTPQTAAHFGIQLSSKNRYHR